MFKIILLVILLIVPSMSSAVEGDHFDRADNTVLGRFWIEEVASTASISSSELVVAGTGSYWDNQSYTTETCVNCRVYVDTKTTNVAGASQIHIRAQGTLNNSLYICWLQSSGWTIGRLDGDSVTDQLAIDSSVTLTANKWYTYYAEIVNVTGNADITCKLYEKGADGRLGALLSTLNYVDSSADKKTTAGVVAVSSNGYQSTYDNFIMINDDAVGNIIDTFVVTFSPIGNFPVLKGVLDE